MATPAATAAASPATLAAPAAALHQAIRRGSQLRPAATQRDASGLAPALVTAYKDTVQAAKQEKIVLQELQEKTHRGSIALKAVPKPSGEKSNNEAAKQAYLAEQEHEADLLTKNSAILRQLHVDDDSVPPPPPADDSSSSSSSSSGDAIPPPPEQPDYLTELVSNPKIRLNLVPVNTPKMIHDGVNPILATLDLIEKKKENITAGLKPTTPVSKDFFLTPEFRDSYKQEEAELAKALRRNSILLEQFRQAQPPPPFPENEADLKEAAEAKAREEEILRKGEPNASAVAASSSSSSSSILEHARRNSKQSYLGDISNPLSRLSLNPTILEETPLAERIKEDDDAKEAAAAAAAAGGK